MDPTNRNTALCSALVDELARMGVEHACVAPGSRSAPLALALWDEQRIKTWSIVDERSAGFFAVGVGQATGKPAVVVTTSGTAAANLHPAVAEAAEARVPLIAITADRPPELRSRGAGQTIDQVKLFGSSVRWFCELGNIDADDDGLLHFRSTGCRAVAEALAETPGPVHLNVPLREPLAPLPAEGQVTATRKLAIEGRSHERPLTRTTPRPPGPADQVVAAIRDVIDRSPRGLIVAGRQTDAELPDALRRLSRATGYPLLAEPTSQARRSGGGVVAAYDTIFRELPERLAPQVVLRFGDMPTSKPLRDWLAAHDDCEQWVVDPDRTWSEPTSVAGAFVRTDPQALCERLGGGSLDGAWTKAWANAEAAAQQGISDYLRELEDQLCEPGVHRLLGDLLEDDVLVYVASSMPIRDLDTFLPAIDANVTFLANRGANGIDGTISSGLGAAAATGRRTIVLLGDVALYHDMNGLLAMKRNGVEATILVLNNGGGRIFDFLPVADAAPDGYEELFTTATGLDVGKIASLYEAEFTQVGSYDQLAGAIARPGVVEVPIDGDQNVAIHSEVTKRVTAALRNSDAG